MMETSQKTLTQPQNTIITTDVAVLDSKPSTSLATEVKALSESISILEKTKPALDSNRVQDTNKSVELILIQERLRQARLSFNLTLTLFVTSGIISIVGIALLFLGKVPEGTVTTAGGLASNIVSLRCLKLNKETNDRLDEIVKDLQDEE
jgi:hypothetical protein